MEQKEFIKHIGCECGSSDAKAVYSDGSSYCFKCLTYRRGQDYEDVYRKRPPLNNEYSEATIAGVKDRNISYSTSQKYGLKETKDAYLFPYNNKDGVVAVKKRSKAAKDFSFAGDAKEAMLFGQQLFTKGGKYITITEGEFDALAAFQMMGSKWPVVSVKNGAAAALKGCKEQYEWLDSFENIVIAFDGDEPGKKAAQQVAELFGNKAKVMKHQKHKDACDYLVSGDAEVWNKVWWSAEGYVPDGIVAGTSLWDMVSAPVVKADVMYPWNELNSLTYGIRKGELITITAGSGLGKSQFAREIVYHVLQNSTDNVGLMFLEEGVQKTARSLMSLAIDKPIHLPDVVASEAELLKAYDLTVGSGRVFLFDHFGSLSIDNVIARVKYMAKGLECGYVILDHISMLVSDGANADERKAIDEVMTKLRTLVQETNISLVCVSHLRRPDGKGHEEGASTSLSQLRGSASIAQLSDMVIGLERNGQHEDPIKRNTTQIRVLKNRYAGLTGNCGGLLYNRDTGRMIEVENVL